MLYKISSPCLTLLNKWCINAKKISSVKLVWELE